MVDFINNIEKVLTAISCLTVYRAVFEDPVLINFREALNLVVAKDRAAVNSYYNLLSRLIKEKDEQNLAGLDLFRDYLLNIITSIENPYSFRCGKYPFEDIDQLLIRAVENDLRLLKIIYDFELIGLENYLTENQVVRDLAPDLGGLIVGESREERYPKYYFDKKASLKKTLILSADWRINIKDFHRFYQKTGSGIFGRFWAFKWNGGNSVKGLKGVINPDPICIGDLVGYEDQKQEILRNTKQFVKGLSANNILLYGDRGTGKSSTIKSLIHIFGAEGLRIIEVSKHDLLSLHNLVSEIEGRAQKFIIFIDDLSFEEDETEYKDLKALLEGSIAKPPANLLIYATSNRRNIVREFFSDRETDEVGKQDTYQEKLSLADRFGIKIVYSAPNKQDYLRTVEELAAKSDIKIEKSELHELALRWVLWHNARSGRTARQFIDDLYGKLNLNE
ncbi:MAG: ATP-binding protein [Bacillota bacterium]|nr:ATP-binding protein [Bacillota bacterium]